MGTNSVVYQQGFLALAEAQTYKRVVGVMTWFWL